LIFKQLFDIGSSTLSYIIGCPETRECVLVDPVLERAHEDLDAIRALDLRLVFSLETHIHADHLTAALKLKHIADSRIAAPEMDALPCADVGVSEEMPLKVGKLVIRPVHTPGHTDTHHAYLIDGPKPACVFTGDALLIGGCGRTDFQGGDPATLFRSVREKLFRLPDETLVYPGHDYNDRRVSSIGQEKTGNSRLSLDKSLNEFLAMMNDLKLPLPKKMSFAVPGNQLCGQCPPDVPPDLRGPCDLHDQG